jgi:dephospho-CoA kinase
MSMSKPLIGIAGRARVGKDTAGLYLADRYGLRRMAFADPVKRVVAELLGVSLGVLETHGKEAPIAGLDRSPRYLYQTLGTEWGRNLVHPDLWVRVLAREHALVERQACVHGVVITDVRMPNEAAWVRERGTLVHITRQDAPAVRAHESEQGVEVLEGDVVLPNDGTIDELYRRLDDLVAEVWTACARSA